jgi:hypothetical protein
VRFALSEVPTLVQLEPPLRDHSYAVTATLSVAAAQLTVAEVAVMPPKPSVPGCPGAVKSPVTAVATFEYPEKLLAASTARMRYE